MPALTPLTVEDMAAIVSDYDHGYSQTDIMIHYRISNVRLAKILTDAGITSRSKGPRKLSPLQEREVLSQWEHGQSMAQIAQQFSCSTEPIKRIIAEAEHLNRLVRQKTGVFMKRAEQDADQMVHDYQRGMSMRAIGVRLGHHPNYVRKILTNRGLLIRDDRTRRGPDCPMFKSGRQTHNEGYVKVWIPENSPFASMRDTKGYVLEHRLVMAQDLNRPLFLHERVHHLNGVRSDNVISNLELWEHSHPPGQRHDEATHQHCPTCTCH